MARALKLLLPALLLSAGAPATASGAQTFGSSLEGTLTDVGCSGPCASSLEATAGGVQATSPIDGVVVRWRLRKGTDPGGLVRLRILRATTATTWTFLRSSGSSLIGGGDGTYTFGAQVPIARGDHIGVDRPDGLDDVFRTASGAVSHLFTPPPQDGASASESAQNNRELLINADVEPDADRDGFGDESQDLCPGNALFQGLCPAAAAPAPAAARPTTDRSAPRLRLAFARTQDVDKLAIVVRTSEAGTVAVRGSVQTTRRRLRSAAVLRLRGASRRMSRRGRVRVRLVLARRSRARVKRLLLRGGRAVARVTVTATDRAGNSRRVSRRIRLRP